MAAPAAARSGSLRIVAVNFGVNDFSSRPSIIETCCANPPFRLLEEELETAGSIPQWITAIVATVALVAAFISIRSQREIARKRAAMDVFFKVEMDKETLDAHRRYTAATQALEAHLKAGHSLEAFSGNEHYWNIRNYLNLHELMAVGIEKQVFDDLVCYFYWSGELFRAHAACKPLIDHIQRQLGERFTYVELMTVNDRWHRRKERPHF